MGPRERFEFWSDIKSWYFGFGVNVAFKCVTLNVGPVGFQYNWDVKNG